MKKDVKELMWAEFKAQGLEGLRANHYTLATISAIHDPEQWKAFLTEPDVSEYILNETALLQQAEFRNILLNTSRDNSAGRAQLINAMLTVNNKQTTKDGPVVIYSYVPLNEQQLKADNIEINKLDPFRR